MSSDTFYNELGVEPFGYVDLEKNKVVIYLEPVNAIHLVKASVPILKSTILSASAYIHKTYSNVIDFSYEIPSENISAIHRVFSTDSVATLTLKVYSAIHKNYFLDKWNASFNWDYSRYLHTPYKLRLAETPVFDKCHDPSTIPGDGGIGSTPGIGGMHNDLEGLQGGIPNEYYHLTLAERNKLALMQQGSITFVDKFKPDPHATGDAWVNSETNILQMYYNTVFNDVSVDHSSTADEVDGGYF